MAIIEHILQAFRQWLNTPDTSWAFGSVPFLGTFCLFLSFYLLIRRYSRKGMLAYVCAFSLLFAWKSSGMLMLLLVPVTMLSWTLTRRMRRMEGWRRKAMAAFAILCTLAPLIYYKYTHFFCEIADELFGTNFALPALLLPVGISFYTFQAISYVADVCRRRWDSDDTLLEYAFYLTFFPLLLAGPITRAGTLLPQVRTLPRPSKRLVYGGLFLLICGLVKKNVMADYIAQYNNWIFDDPTSFSGFEDMAGIVGYTLQIYLDFSGYSDMSIGLAGILGFRLLENFRLPYQSLNVTEFWRRWHISLSTWFRDYVYIPLGGNRHGKLRRDIGCLVTMLAAGLWHGASWMFLIWGALHGVALVLHKRLKPLLDEVPDVFFVRVLAWMITFGYIMFTWTVFRSDSLDTLQALYSNIAATFSWDYLTPFAMARPVWTVFVFMGLTLHAIRYKAWQHVQAAFIRSPWLVKLLLMAVAVAAIVYFRNDEVQPFIYSQF